MREIYAPFEQLPSGSMGIVVRSRANPAALADAIRNAVWAIDADQPVSLIRPIQSMMDDMYAGFQIVTDLMAFFSALSLFLAALGIYAVMAFNVTQRTHEIGIRMALGAHPREILRLVLGSGAWLTGAGIAIRFARRLRGFPRSQLYLVWSERHRSAGICRRRVVARSGRGGRLLRSRSPRHSRGSVDCVEVRMTFPTPGAKSRPARKAAP